MTESFLLTSPILLDGTSRILLTGEIKQRTWDIIDKLERLAPIRDHAIASGCAKTLLAAAQKYDKEGLIATAEALRVRARKLQGERIYNELEEQERLAMNIMENNEKVLACQFRARLPYSSKTIDNLIKRLKAKGKIKAVSRKWYVIPRSNDEEDKAE